MLSGKVLFLFLLDTQFVLDYSLILDNDSFALITTTNEQTPHNTQLSFPSDFMESDAEDCWRFVEQAVKIDNAGAAGTALDEMEAHRFLEKADEAHTVLEMRSRLRKTGAIGQSERPKTVPLSHYLLFKYDNKSDKLFHDLVTRTQGDNSKQIEEAQAKLDAVAAAFEEAAAAASAAAASLDTAQKTEAAAKTAETEAISSAEAATKREAEAKTSAETLAVKEEELKKSQAELEAALAEVKKQEDAYNAKTADLTKKSEEGGVVSRNKAKNELAQHLAEDPLPLRKAKITLGFFFFFPFFSFFLFPFPFSPLLFFSPPSLNTPSPPYIQRLLSRRLTRPPRSPKMLA